MFTYDLPELLQHIKSVSGMLPLGNLLIQQLAHIHTNVCILKIAASYYISD